jgi:hypothetical protein
MRKPQRGNEKQAAKEVGKSQNSPKRKGKTQQQRQKKMKIEEKKDLDEIIAEVTKGDEPKAGNDGKHDAKAKQVSEGGSAIKARKRKNLANKYGQAKHKLSTPSSTQCRAYIAIRERVRKGKKVSMTDLLEVEGELNQLSLLVNVATLKVIDHAEAVGAS